MTSQDQELTRKQKRRLAEFIPPFEGGAGLAREALPRPSILRLRGCIKWNRRASRWLEKPFSRCPSIRLS